MSNEVQWEARRWCSGDKAFSKWQPCTEAQKQEWSERAGEFEFRQVTKAKIPEVLAIAKGTSMNEYVYIVTFEGPEWSIIVGVFIGHQGNENALALQRDMRAGKHLDRLNEYWRNPIYRSLSDFYVKEYALER